MLKRQTDRIDWDLLRSRVKAYKLSLPKSVRSTALAHYEEQLSRSATPSPRRAFKKTAPAVFGAVLKIVQKTVDGASRQNGCLDKMLRYTMGHPGVWQRCPHCDEVHAGPLFCSLQCSTRHDNDVKSASRRATNLERYGVESHMQVPEIAKRLGEISKARSPEAKAAQLAKARVTWMDKYGVDNCSKAQVTKDKIRASLLANFGSHETFLADRAEKSKVTSLKKYGVEHYQQDPGIKQKAVDYYRKTLGCDHPSQHPVLGKRFIHQRYGQKRVVLSDGRKLTLQGYEPIVAHELDQAGLIVGSPDFVIKYRHPDGRTHAYHPDLFVINPETQSRYLVEVKSPYTLFDDRTFDMNVAKFQAASRECKKRDVQFTLCVCDSDNLVDRLVNPNKRSLLRLRKRVLDESRAATR